MGKVNFAGVIRDVCLEYVPEALVGDHCLVHVGFALAVIDEAAAAETLRVFAAAGLLEDEAKQSGPDGGESDPQADREGVACWAPPGRPAP